MTLGITIWVLLSGALLVFLGWTVGILIRQKKAWKQFSKARKMRYSVSGLMMSPEVTGVIDGYSVSLFVGEHETEQSRTPRKMSAIEVMLKSTMPVPLALGSGNMVRLIQGLGYAQEYRPDVKGWNKDYIAQSPSENAMRKYLTESRLKSLLKLMAVKNAWVILISDGKETLLRLDTPDPLDDVAQIDKLVKGMIKVAKLLELEKGEDDVLVSESKRQDSDQPVNLDIGDEVPDFELEEDD